jgi:hypothetical protein
MITVTPSETGQPATLAPAAEAAPALAGLLEDFIEGLGVVEQYPWPVPFRCSAECGQPIRQGNLAVQTSPGLQPLERAHLVCLLNRKGADSERAEDGTPVTADDVLGELVPA